MYEPSIKPTITPLFEMSRVEVSPAGKLREATRRRPDMLAGQNDGASRGNSAE
jgi:hypothetical protein